MSAPAQAKPAVPDAASLSGAEKVAVLLLALGKPRAAKLLKRFDPDDLKILTQLAGDLRTDRCIRPGRAGGGVRPEVLQRHQFRRHRKRSEEHAFRRDERGPARRRHVRRAGRAGRGARTGLGQDRKDQGRRAARLSEQRAPADGSHDPFAHRPGHRCQDCSVVSRAAAQRAADPHARHQESIRRCGARRGGGHSGGPRLPNHRQGRTPASPTS